MILLASLKPGGPWAGVQATVQKALASHHCWQRQADQEYEKLPSRQIHAPTLPLSPDVIASE